ncbi:hypothetical protein [Tatumella sp. UBA2305]|uniref:hypothetical protein n=1 Tax=Tatumella sp. UBA2305 TaxID=1947647 RepID=UPI0025F5F785|nr:hypothetical protein [Tatumella sp. UBA2305]
MITINDGIRAIDALSKIKSLLSAAQWLTASGEETELQLELLNLAESIAAKTLEGCQ